MANAHHVRCSDNEAVALHLLTKRQELAESNAISDALDSTLSKAHRAICAAQTPIQTLKDLSQIKGVGKWTLRLMKGFFPEDVVDSSGTAENGAAKRKGKQAKGPRKYVPQKNSVAYALLITLYRALEDGTSFMKKQELIEVAEASGLSRTAIVADKSIGRSGQFGRSRNEWYTGWNCMKTLVLKGLVVKSSCPAKYMLTEEGKEVARECLSRSTIGLPVATDKCHDVIDVTSTVNVEPIDVACNLHELDTQLVNKNLPRDTVDSYSTDSAIQVNKQLKKTSTAFFSADTGSRLNSSSGGVGSVHSSNLASEAFNLRACTSSVSLCKEPLNDAKESEGYFLAVPPCRSGEKFEDIYDVILILDDRENFGSRSRKVVDSICAQFKVLVEVRRLPIGDGIWIARNKDLHKEYVLDFIVERKKVEDLCSSIRDNRYRDQKLRLQRCGIRKLIYLVEGDPNSLEAAESIKTACFTTEILEGFDVQRTSGFMDTMKRYGYLTQSITQYYRGQSGKETSPRHAPTFDEFIRRCQDLGKVTVSDVFALQLMQVPQVTEEVALAVLDLYPTIFSLAQAYSQIEGNVRVQEEMLQTRSKMISKSASKNIFKLVWGS